MRKPYVRWFGESKVGRHALFYRVGWMMTSILCGVALGCGDSGEIHEAPITDEAYPVKGKVLLSDGKPAQEGHVVFNPVKSPGLQAQGVIETDGTFSLTSRKDGDGALAGDYHVLVVLPPVRKELKRYAKYANEDTPLLKASVTSGPNELDPFRLK